MRRLVKRLLEAILVDVLLSLNVKFVNQMFVVLKLSTLSTNKTFSFSQYLGLNYSILEKLIMR